VITQGLSAFRKDTAKLNSFFHKCKLLRKKIPQKNIHKPCEGHVSAHRNQKGGHAQSGGMRQDNPDCALPLPPTSLMLMHKKLRLNKSLADTNGALVLDGACGR